MSGHKSKKRKVSSQQQDENAIDNVGAAEVDTSKPSAIYRPKSGRKHTTSIALPGSIISNSQTHDSKTALVGQIARACTVFCVDEIVVFDDGQAPRKGPERDGYTAYSDPNFFLYHVLSYLECPPHLRKRLFPIHPDLRTAGALPSLDAPHHLKADEWCQYREGVTAGTSSAGGTTVECGLSEQVFVADEIERDVRVTIKLPEDRPQRSSSGLEAQVVGPEAPREEGGYYWGYSLRQAASLSAVYTECPFDGGYDVSIGTSERGTHVTSLFDKCDPTYIQPTWDHLVIIFGGVAGLEMALKADQELQSAAVKEVSELFDRWVNLVPGQGSRTIRTEEAVWTGLMGLRGIIEARDAV
ncbi:DUF171-domain-containing protein [Polychaeton citri CBS 116435]|uniref:DUF171-domain-containing protein n=1 Tax=Polychaeton citri CBS 116435 TaxID=1314669 RepID=A0A9P4USE9_9PEZI|nr:DUF171-domain-containing protein [Polychaeton citri CBS 116435]